MNTTLTYYPGKGISINETEICWDFERFNIRQLLGNIHHENDSVIEISKYTDDRENLNIVFRRDIYENYCGGRNYFFLNYDKNNLLKNIEIHYGILIVLENLKLSFDMNFEDAVSLLKKLSSHNKELSQGEHFFKDLNLIIANGESLGGNGKELAYFYCSQNVDQAD